MLKTMSSIAGRMILVSATLFTSSLVVHCGDGFAVEVESPEQKSDEAASAAASWGPLQGLIATDLWGWSGTINYQRTKGHATPEYFVEKIAQESNRWGANFVECMPFKYSCGGYVMSWNPDDPIPQPGKGVYFYSDPSWTDEKYRWMLSEFHRRDMLSALVVNSIGATWGLPEGEGWERPTVQIECDVMERWSRDFFNPLLYRDGGAYFDVFDTERLTGCEIPLMWTYNPGATPMFDGSSDSVSDDWTYAFCCAGLNRNGIRGLDDHASYDLAQGNPYFSYQADCRPRKTFHPWGHFGGFVYPDWFIKQVFDYCRVRKETGNNLHTAFWWFNEVQEMHEPIDRHYIYGASMDPLRSALAARHFVTGQFDERTANLNPDSVGGLEMYPVLRGSPYIQNNHLKLYLSSWQDRQQLVCDTTRLGEYDDNAPATIVLATDFLRTEVADLRNSSGVLGAIDGKREDFERLWEEGGKRLEFSAPSSGRYVIAIAQLENWDSASLALKIDDRVVDTVVSPELPQSPHSYVHLKAIELEEGSHVLSLAPGKDCLSKVDAISVQRMDYVGNADGSHAELKSSGGFGGPEAVYAFDWSKDSAQDFPGGLEPGGKKWPKSIEMSFVAEAGFHVLNLHVGKRGPLEFFLDGERIRIEYVNAGESGFGTLPVFFGISTPGRHNIRMLAWDEEISIDSIGMARLFDKGVSQRVVEPAGYLACITEEISIPTESGSLLETRNIATRNDCPWIEWSIQRSTTGDATVTTIIDCRNYTELVVNSNVYSAAVALDRIPDEMFLKSPEGGAPDLLIGMIDKGNVRRLVFSPGDTIRMESSTGQDERIRFALFVSSESLRLADVSGRVAQLLEIEEWFSNTDFSQPIEVHNPLPIPVVKTLAISGYFGGPFYVLEEPEDGSEQGWWLFRGAQQSFSGLPECYLKTYIKQAGRVSIQKYDYIKGIVKTGIGSQYIATIREDIDRDGCTCQVHNVTPYVFAPSVVFNRDFDSVTVNGQQWHYFDGSTVYLPNVPGIYRVEVRTRNQATAHLLRTQALVHRVIQENNTLTLLAEDPPWFDHGLDIYYAAIDLEGYRIAGLDNGTETIPIEGLRLLNPSDYQAMADIAILKIKTGETHIELFKER